MEITYRSHTWIIYKNIIGLVTIDLPIDEKDPTSIPIVIKLLPEEFSKIGKKGNHWIVEPIFTLIKKYNELIYNSLLTMHKVQIVCLIKNESYEKGVVAFVKAAELNKKYNWKQGKETTKDSYIIYLDNREHRIIISIYYGSRCI